MTPVHWSVIVAVWIVLENQMPVAMFVNETIGVDHPTMRWSEVIHRTMLFKPID